MNLGDKVFKQGIQLYSESQLTENGRLMSQTNFVRNWMLGCFMDQKWGWGETKLRCHLILQISSRIASLRQGACASFHFLTAISQVVWNRISHAMSLNKDAITICNSAPTKCEFLSHASKQQRSSAISHKGTQEHHSPSQVGRVRLSLCKLNKDTFRLPLWLSW